ncbi:MAG: sugar ABC transporter permease [Spirochaetia bacterium]|jgi:raffinose/stachyose/melibiose transport system permease protein
MFKYCKRWIKLLFFTPVLIFFGVYTVYPIFYSLLISFQNKPTFMPGRFVGLANYLSMFADTHLRIALSNSAIITIGELILIIPFSFLLGMFINMKFRGSDVVKLLCFTPYILSTILTTQIWFFIVDPGIGILNILLKSVHLDALAFQWIGGKYLTPYTVTVIESWKALGFYSVLFMAGLRMIPRELFEASQMDGASGWQNTRFITIPMLKETLKIVTIYIVLNAIQSLQTVYILTNGGPNYYSHTVASYMYERLVWARQAGYASSIAFLMFVILMVFSVGTLRITARRIED